MGNLKLAVAGIRSRAVLLNLLVLLLLIALAQTSAKQGPTRLTQKIRDVTAVDSRCS